MIRFCVLILISLLASLSSCEPPVEKPPVDLIEESKFKDMTIALHLLESFVKEEYDRRDTTRTAFKHLEQQLYKKFNVTEENYRTSQNYYMRDTEHMDDMYEEIVDSLSKMETQARVKKEKK